MARGHSHQLSPRRRQLPQAAPWLGQPPKTTFRAHQLTLESEQQATRERGNIFGSTSAATALHSITDATARPGVHTSPDTLSFHAASGPSSPHASNLVLKGLFPP